MIELDYSKKDFDQQHQKTVLPNGLTILSMQRKDISSVIIEVWVNFGSRYEDAKTNGIAHFIEHLNFKGTKKRSAKQIAEEFDAVGGHLNAYTTKEHTVYSAKILKEFLPFAIDMISDIMFNSVYNEQEIEKEKDVVLQELAQTKDDPDDLVFEYFLNSTFKEQALGRSILGKEENIKSFHKEQVIEFVHKYYTAPRIIVSVVGDFDHVNLIDLIEEKFTPFENVAAENYTNAVYVGGSRYENNPELAQLHLVIGYEGLAINSKDYYTLEILSNIWGGSISSRLFQEIREKRGLVYSVGSFSQYYKEVGLFGVSASTSKEQANELLEVLSNEVKKITENVTEEELNRCLAQVKSALYMSREIADNWVGILASNYFYFNRYLSREEIWRNYSSVTTNNITNLAKKIFAKSKPITVSFLGDTNNLPNYSSMQKLLTV